ncbi:MAG TPA: YlzJ-like family protein [Acetivibrio sp.]|uniref:YlzJ-like family protein n=1 Tax=Acetivibrio sp. TaxID=1872092 RepID=UPI002C3D909C|nr:YlzJ-like family protein [Acetivibrio sp.]HOM01414.1 YlzJ-like family protein [Acetivibrio sp.]
MILYSIVPTEIVFGNFGVCENQNYIEVDYSGERVVVMPLSNNRYMISRVISTSPKAFLNPKLMPGNIITGHF